jgi:hypothetical protein
MQLVCSLGLFLSPFQRALLLLPGLNQEQKGE